MTREPLRIAFVGTIVPRTDEALYPTFSHASAIFQKNILEALARAGFTVDRIFSVRQSLLYPHDRRLWFRTQHQIADEGPPLVQLPFLNIAGVKTACLAASLLRRLLAWSRRRRLILLYNLYPAPAAISLLAARLTGARVIAIVADLHVPGAGTRPAGLMNRIDFALQTWAMPRLDGLIVLTRQMAADFARDAPVLHMEGGVEESGAAGSQPAGAGRAVMYSGGLSEFRGVSLLLDAFRRLRGEYELWITGRGELEHEVQFAAAKDPRIKYFGVVERERLRELYARAAVLVNPLITRYASSRYIFPSKLLEYMATGTPVLTTMPPDVAAEYAQYVYGFNETPEELAAAIERVLALPAEERETFGAQARAFVLEKKNWRTQGERVTRFIAEVMAR